jgi:Asp-tRNA(Asn)/Glu-tRNA(Gln) amidotransferase A subunit family amidase
LGAPTDNDTVGAFLPGTRVRIDGHRGGPLAGLTFAAKDLFDVAGQPTAGGNPDWPRWYPIPTRHAWAAQTLLDAGAALVGKTITATDPLRDRISCLAAHGGLAGFPQVSIPGATVDGAPVGLSILGARRADATLVAVARALEQNV